MRDTNSEYWSDYDGLQHAKHCILRNYLSAWFPILTSWSGEVLYIDCNAGRGRHETGDEGSPLIALNCLLNHKHRDRIISNAKVNFIFFENNEYNAKLLQEEINKLGRLPEKINCKLICDDYQKQLIKYLDTIKNGRFSPAFAFIDPYGFKISMSLLNRLLNFNNCELFINLMYRYIDMAMHKDSQKGNLDELFGCSIWQEFCDIENPDERLSQTIKLFCDQLHSAYVTTMIMRGERNQVKYILIHAANHQRAREEMKKAIWKVIPDGSFTAYECNNPNQLVLIEPKPDLSPLEDIIRKNFSGKKVRMNDIYYVIDNTLYLRKHIHEILERFLKEGIIKVSEYEGRFAFNKNPLISFPDYNQLSLNFGIKTVSS